MLFPFLAYNFLQELIVYSTHKKVRIISYVEVNLIIIYDIKILFIALPSSSCPANKGEPALKRALHF